MICDPTNRIITIDITLNIDVVSLGIFLLQIMINPIIPTHNIIGNKIILLPIICKLVSSLFAKNILTCEKTINKIITNDMLALTFLTLKKNLRINHEVNVILTDKTNGVTISCIGISRKLS